MFLRHDYAFVEVVSPHVRDDNTHLRKIKGHLVNVNWVGILGDMWYPKLLGKGNCAGVEEDNKPQFISLPEATPDEQPVRRQKSRHSLARCPKMTLPCR